MYTNEPTHWDGQVIAPILIMYRISTGISWEQMTSGRLASRQMMFANLERTSAMDTTERQEVSSLDAKIEQ